MIKFDGEDIPIEDLPKPQGWQILLAPITIEDTTSGGIILVKDEVEAKEHIRFISKVLAIGPLAYTGDRFKPHPKANSIIPWCKVGDIVSTGQYTGSKIPCTDKEGNKFYFRIVADDEIRTVIPTIDLIDV